MPDGANFDYSINLTNSNTSSAAIGTFWYAWNLPNVNYLATHPISETPPSGWSVQVTNVGPGDGYGILFTANSSASYLAPGSSLNFSFTTVDAPASVNGNSLFYPGIPVNTSFVYPQGAFSDAGHEFVVQPAATPAPPSTPLVTVTNVALARNKKHQVTGITVNLSGAVNSAEADSLATYRLALPGKKGSFTAKNAKLVPLRSAAYDASQLTITLTPRKAFAQSKPVELLIHGQPPSGLQDASGQFIDGIGDGLAGGDAVFLLSPAGVTHRPSA
jgi:hypothetical protein